MRILTVRQPWAWSTIHLGKNVENRARNIAGSYRGAVAIHAGLDVDVEGLTDPLTILGAAFKRLDYGAGHPDTLKESPRGAIIGVVDLVGVHTWKRSAAAGEPVCFDDHTPIGTMCSKWAQESPWHLELANPRALSEPIPYRGALGLRTLDDATEAQILAAVV